MSIYRINYTDTQKTPIFLNSGVLNSSSLDITLIGMNVMEYGVEFDDDILHILENFAAYENPSDPATPDLTKVIAPVLSHPTQGELWYNKTQSLLFVYTGSAWESLMLRDDVSGNSGIIVHGAQLPLPSGITSYAQCSWFVSPQYIDANPDYIECYTDQNAVVYSRYRISQSEVLVESLANYIIIGIQNLDNTHVPFPLPSVPPAPSTTLTPTPSTSISPTISITPTATPAPGSTRTATPTITPTNTLTPTSSTSITPTISLSATVTPTPTPTPTMTVSVSPFIKSYVLNAQVGPSVNSNNPVGFYNSGDGDSPTTGNFGSMSPNMGSPVPNAPYFYNIALAQNYVISQLFAFTSISTLQFTMVTDPNAGVPPQNAFNEISFRDNNGNLHNFFSNIVTQFLPNSGFFVGYPSSTWFWTYTSPSPPIFLGNSSYIINIQ